MISSDDVKKMAKLARVELDAKEERDLARDLESVVGYIDKLKEVNISGIEDASHVFHVNDFREDLPPKEIFDFAPLLDLAPEKERGFIKVKKILDK
ncbi:MAG: Asp-tRNA(Asn)/Glu-tRNA(Gln) amidotransferase subunit GatC [Patescibacteria group bacterium]